MKSSVKQAVTCGCYAVPHTPAKLLSKQIQAEEQLQVLVFICAGARGMREKPLPLPWLQSRLPGEGLVAHLVDVFHWQILNEREKERIYI